MLSSIENNYYLLKDLKSVKRLAIRFLLTKALTVIDLNDGNEPFLLSASYVGLRKILMSIIQAIAIYLQ